MPFSEDVAVSTKECQKLFNLRNFNKLIALFSTEFSTIAKQFGVFLIFFLLNLLEVFFFFFLIREGKTLFSAFNLNRNKKKTLLIVVGGALKVNEAQNWEALWFNFFLLWLAYAIRVVCSQKSLIIKYFIAGWLHFTMSSTTTNDKDDDDDDERLKRRVQKKSFFLMKTGN